jgi:hypothetical protein
MTWESISKIMILDHRFFDSGFNDRYKLFLDNGYDRWKFLDRDRWRSGLLRRLN